MATSMITPAVAIPDIPEAAPKKASDAAKQFEGFMLGQMLKSARETTSEDDDDSEGETMLDVADQQFAQVMANNGGIGLAQIAMKGLGKSNADQQ